jgi:hypothetical protein
LFNVVYNYFVKAFFFSVFLQLFGVKSQFLIYFIGKMLYNDNLERYAVIPAGKLLPAAETAHNI